MHEVRLLSIMFEMFSLLNHSEPFFKKFPEGLRNIKIPLNITLIIGSWIFTLDIGQRPAKNWVMSDGSCFRMAEWTHLSGVKLKNIFISYRHVKSNKHFVSIGFSCSCFSFYEHFNRHRHFFIFTTVICVWVKRIYTNTFFFFCSVWTVFFFENILYVIK